MDKSYKLYKARYDLSEALRLSEKPGPDYKYLKQFHVETYMDGKLTGFYTRQSKSDAEQLAKQWTGEADD